MDNATRLYPTYLTQQVHPVVSAKRWQRCESVPQVGLAQGIVGTKRGGYKRDTHPAPAAIGLEVQHNVLAQIVGPRGDGGNADGVPCEPADAGHIQEQELVGLHLGSLHHPQLYLMHESTNLTENKLCLSSCGQDLPKNPFRGQRAEVKSTLLSHQIGWSKDCDVGEKMQKITELGAPWLLF